MFKSICESVRRSYINENIRPGLCINSLYNHCLYFQISLRYFKYNVNAYAAILSSYERVSITDIVNIELQSLCFYLYRTLQGNMRPILQSLQQTICEIRRICIKNSYKYVGDFSEKQFHHFGTDTLTHFYKFYIEFYKLDCIDFILRQLTTMMCGQYGLT